MGATHYLPALIGNQNASRLLLTGEVISGTEAESITVLPRDVMTRGTRGGGREGGREGEGGIDEHGDCFDWST